MGDKGLKGNPSIDPLLIPLIRQGHGEAGFG